MRRDKEGRHFVQMNDHHEYVSDDDLEAASDMYDRLIESNKNKEIKKLLTEFDVYNLNKLKEVLAKVDEELMFCLYSSDDPNKCKKLLDPYFEEINKSIKKELERMERN